MRGACVGEGVSARVDTRPSSIRPPFSANLPTELVIASGSRPPQRMTPLRTFPPIDVARGGEGRPEGHRFSDCQSNQKGCNRIPTRRDIHTLPFKLTNRLHPWALLNTACSRGSAQQRARQRSFHRRCHGAGQGARGRPEVRPSPVLPFSFGSAYPPCCTTLTVSIVRPRLLHFNRVAVEVWSKERFRSDTLLGLASVPLHPLLQDCRVDAYVPVLALMVRAPLFDDTSSSVNSASLSCPTGPFGSRSTQCPSPVTLVLQVTPGSPGKPMREEQMQVGMVRIAVSLESPEPAPAALPLPGSLMPPTPWHADPATGSAQARQHYPAAAERPSAAAATVPTPRKDSLSALAAAAAAPPPPEYQVAWELEVWKRGAETGDICC